MQKEALFRRLMQTGETLTVISCSATDEDGRPSGATSLLADFLEDMKLWTLISAPLIELSDLTPTEGNAYFPSIEAPLSERIARGIPAARSAPEPSGPPHLAVSDLYELLDCPFRWWLKRNAKLRERRTTLLNMAEAGELTHMIWQNVWRRRAEDPRDPLPVLAAGEWQMALNVDEDYGSFAHLLSDRRLRRNLKNLEFYVARLAGVQQEILDRLAASGIRHRMLFMEEDLFLSTETDGVIFTGRCDRVELLDENQVVIMDYKLGRSASYEKSLSRLDLRRCLPSEILEGRESFKFGFQLSAYALMYARRFPEHEIAGVGFLGHRDGGVAGTFAPESVARCYLPDPKVVHLRERVVEAETALRCAAAILKSGRYEPCYTADSCRYCDMKGVCRRGELRGEALMPDVSADGDAGEGDLEEGNIREGENGGL
jgi:CRISPR/Cas system-associated exonuclease Cas4 (RecB family)